MKLSFFLLFCFKFQAETLSAENGGLNDANMETKLNKYGGYKKIGLFL